MFTQDEVDALLRSAAADPSRKVAASPNLATTYNFRRPDRVSKDQVRSLHFLHDRFARNVSTSLSAYLRAATEVSLVSVEQFTYAEFLSSLPDPTAFYAITLPPLEGMGALELNPVVAFTMIDRMLGGSGQRVITNRALAARETRPQMLQVAVPNEPMILLVFDLRIGGARGMLNLCIPAAGIETLGTSVTQGWQGTQRRSSPEERRVLHENLGRVPLAVSAMLETTMTARELLTLKPGDVVCLGVPIERPLRIKVAGMDRFEGRPVRVGQNAGCVVDAVPAPPATNSGAAQ
jgi:flagellar motor switch protein FliM